MPEIDIQVTDHRYARRVKKLQTFCRHVMTHAWHDQEPAEISLVLADDAFVQQLNKQYRQKDMPTNVLSFEVGHRPAQGMPWIAGDIIVAYETVLKEAKALNISFEAHFAHLLVHGTLHLQGYDHIKLTDAHKMEALEVKLLNALGYDNPYENLED